MVDIKEKLRQYAAYKDISLRKLSNKIGKSDKFLATNGPINSNVLPIIKKEFSDLNMNWLIFDEGEMIINDINQPILYQKIESINNKLDNLESVLFSQISKEIKTQLNFAKENSINKEIS